jgi:hypothetical protein
VEGPSLGLATDYQLTGPVGVAADRAGDIYFTDGNRVYEVVQATGQLEVVAGTGKPGYSGNGGPGPRAALSSPSGITVAPNGDVYFEDGNRIRMVSAADGIISTVAGDGHTGSSGNGGPALRASLDLGSPVTGASGLEDVLAVSPFGDLYIAEPANNEVEEVTPSTGVITRVAGGGDYCGPLDGICAARVHPCAPVGVTIDHSSNIFVATACGLVREISATTGRRTTTFSAPRDPALAGSGSSSDLIGLAVGDDGHLLVAEAYGRRLLDVTLRTGKVTLVAGTGVQTLPQVGQTAGDGGPAAQATFGLVSGTAVDASGTVYVADLFNNAIRRIDAGTGIITTVAGEIPTSPAHCC